MDEGKLLTMKHYSQVGNIYASNSPSLSRYFMSKLNDTLLYLGQREINNKTKEAFENKIVGHQCPRCGSLLSNGTDNSSVKLKPRKGPSKKTVKLIKQCNMFNNWNKLSSKARKDILRYKRQTNKLVINCVICGRSSTDCVKRKQKPKSNSSLPSTPVTSVRTLLHTPLSSGSKNRTPNSQTFLTPSSSAKKRSAKLQKHAQLQMMLDQNKQEKQRAQHSPLHGFLKSL